jgi:hypothetical protein
MSENDIRQRYEFLASASVFFRAEPPHLAVDRFKHQSPVAVIPRMPDDPAIARVEDLLPGIDVQVNRKVEIDPAIHLGRSGFHLDPQGNGGEILNGTVEKRTILYDLDVSSRAGVTVHFPGADLTARLREKKFNPLVAHLDYFGYDQEKFLSVCDEKIV